MSSSLFTILEVFHLHGHEISRLSITVVAQLIPATNCTLHSAHIVGRESVCLILRGYDPCIAVLGLLRDVAFAFLGLLRSGTCHSPGHLAVLSCVFLHCASLLLGL